MKAYAAQLHLHGSMSEGPASCLAHDHMAAETGHADVLWWTDHDFRVSNFGKFRRTGFTGLREEVDQPNRNAEAAERVVKVPLEWKAVGAEGEAAPSSAVVFGEGAASLHVVLPAGDASNAVDARGAEERRCLYELQMGAHYETFPLITRPVLKLAVFPGQGVGSEGQVVIAMTLSEQPPDLINTRLTYVVGGPPAGEPQAGDREGVVSLPFTPGRWNEYRLDVLADVERLGLRGGADNSLHRLRLGVASRGPHVEAHFGQLEVEVEHRGPGVLDLHRKLLASLPTRVRHHVGLEVSYYGRHITGFGASVPIPDYDTLLPGGLTSEEVVAHIQDHGGLACLAHPSRVDPETTAAQLAERRLYGADMMEVAHASVGLADRLRLWDLLARHGLVVTGIGVSDAHSAKAGWRAVGERPAAWVTRIWAESDEEDDLLEGLRRGRVFFADPSVFRGDLWLSGPGGAEMGDVVVTGGDQDGAAGPALRVRVSGAEADDLVAWYVNGHLVHAHPAADEGEWRLPVKADRLQAVRVELRRPKLVGHAFGGLIACSNPIYLCPEAPQTGHRVIRLAER